MSEMIRQKKNKVFPHAPYDMYSHYSPVFGYFVDDDNTSPTFGEVLFGQIGERDDYEMKQSFRDDCDMTLIKQQLLKSANANDWSAEFIDYDNEEVEDAEAEAQGTSNSAYNSDETTVESGTINPENKEEA